MSNTKSTSPCRILFLEDDAQDVELMKYALDVAGFPHVSTHAFSKQSFIDALDNFNPDIILADYSLPMFNGMHAYRIFKERGAHIPFILVTGALPEELALEYQDEGIDDFILKSSYKRLPSVITRNLEIKRAQMERDIMSAELARRNAELRQMQSETEITKTHELLSNREFEILCLIASGQSIKEIANQLHLSPATVATYRARILEKMDFRSNIDLTRYALRHNLTD